MAGPVGDDLEMDQRWGARASSLRELRYMGHRRTLYPAAYAAAQRLLQSLVYRLAHTADGLRARSAVVVSPALLQLHRADALSFSRRPPARVGLQHAANPLAGADHDSASAARPDGLG